jgi:hypothetical protein
MHMRLAPIVFGIGLVLQFGIPAWKLSQPRPQRLGWQMYSAAHPMPSVVVVSHAGVESPIQYAEFLAVPRAELPPDAWRGLPAHLCATRPRLAAVRLRLQANGPWETHACR